MAQTQAAAAVPKGWLTTMPKHLHEGPTPEQRAAYARLLAAQGVPKSKQHEYGSQHCVVKFVPGLVVRTGEPGKTFQKQHTTTTTPP